MIARGIRPRQKVDSGRGAIRTNDQRSTAMASDLDLPAPRVSKVEEILSLAQEISRLNSSDVVGKMAGEPTYRLGIEKATP